MLSTTPLLSFIQSFEWHFHSSTHLLLVALSNLRWKIQKKVQMKKINMATSNDDIQFFMQFFAFLFIDVQCISSLNLFSNWKLKPEWTWTVAPSLRNALWFHMTIESNHPKYMTKQQLFYVVKIREWKEKKCRTVAMTAVYIHILHVVVCLSVACSLCRSLYVNVPIASAYVCMRVNIVIYWQTFVWRILFLLFDSFSTNQTMQIHQ